MHIANNYTWTIIGILKALKKPNTRVETRRNTRATKGAKVDSQKKAKKHFQKKAQNLPGVPAETGPQSTTIISLFSSCLWPDFNSLLWAPVGQPVDLSFLFC